MRSPFEGLSEKQKGALFAVGMDAVETLLLRHGSELCRAKPETFEHLAKSLNEALAMSEASTLPDSARRKGRALIDLCMAAAEFSRATMAYAEASILQMAEREK